MNERGAENRRTVKSELLGYYVPRAVAFFMILNVIGGDPIISAMATAGILGALALERIHRNPH